MAKGGRWSPLIDRVDALQIREVDDLICKLLAEINLDFAQLGNKVLRQIAELKRVLIADYCEAPGLPGRNLVTELSQLVETEIRPRNTLVPGSWDNQRLVKEVQSAFRDREIEVRARPYRHGAGLALRGFCCRAELNDRRKFVIFLNTAHVPLAVATTFGHELGHYVYGAFTNQQPRLSAFVEGTLTQHLEDCSELFADSLVALAAYDRELIGQIGAVSLRRGKSAVVFEQIKQAYQMMRSRYEIDFAGFARQGIARPNRVRYLTTMIHFVKLRAALFATAGV